MAITVRKYGGSSLANVDAILRSATQVIEIARSGRQIVVVVSAMGNHTNRLIRQAKQLCDEPAGHALDALLATGEQQAAAKMTLALEQLGVRVELLAAHQLGISTDCCHNRANICEVDVSNVLAALDHAPIVVAPGFQGVSAVGRLTTLGRGGSDTTAVALAAGLMRSGYRCECEILSDVDGVYSADPAIVRSAELLPVVDAEWMVRFAAAGASVMHDRAARIARDHRVPVVLASSTGGEAHTRIIAGDSQTARELRLVGCTHVPGQAGRSIVSAVATGDAIDPMMIERIWQRLAEQRIEVVAVDSRADQFAIDVASIDAARVLQIMHDALVKQTEQERTQILPFFSLPTQRGVSPQRRESAKREPQAVVATSQPRISLRV